MAACGGGTGWNWKIKIPQLIPGYFLVIFTDYFSAFLAAGFFAGAFLAAVFLAAGFFAGAFLAAVFLAVAGFVAGFLAASNVTPAFLAILLNALFRRAAVFFLIKPFLTAVSISLCAAARVFALGSAEKALTAVLMSFLMLMFRSRRFRVCLARLMADLMIGMFLLYLYRFVSLIRKNYTENSINCKEAA